MTALRAIGFAFLAVGWSFIVWLVAVLVAEHLRLRDLRADAQWAERLDIQAYRDREQFTLHQSGRGPERAS
jgi:hypothetical protein